MTDNQGNTRSIVIERDLPYPADRIWRALTQPELIGEWLMAGDIRPAEGHSFAFHADWGSVDCTVLSVQPETTISYTWNSGDLVSVVTWTLSPAPGGTRLRMEQTGFRSDQAAYYGGAKQGWPAVLDALEALLARNETGKTARISAGA